MRPTAHPAANLGLCMCLSIAKLLWDLLSGWRACVVSVAAIGNLLSFQYMMAAQSLMQIRCAGPRLGPILQVHRDAAHVVLVAVDR